MQPAGHKVAENLWTTSQPCLRSQADITAGRRHKRPAAACRSRKLRLLAVKAAVAAPAGGSLQKKRPSGASAAHQLLTERPPSL